MLINDRSICFVFSIDPGFCQWANENAINSSKQDPKHVSENESVFYIGTDLNKRNKDIELKN